MQKVKNPTQNELLNITFFYLNVGFDTIYTRDAGVFYASEVRKLSNGIV